MDSLPALKAGAIELKPCEQFKIYQPWSEPVRYGIGTVRKIFY